MNWSVRRFLYSDLTISAACGVLLGMGFYVPAAWPLVFIGLVPLLYVHAVVPVDWKRRVLRGFVLGLPLYSTALAGIFWHTLPVDWFGITAPTLQVLAVGATWLIAVSVLSLGTAAFSLVLPFIASGWRGVVLIPLTWVAGEWLGALLFSILLAGPGSLVGAHFTLGYLGYLLAHEPALLQLAAWGGVYVLSALVIFVNVLVYRAWRATTTRERRMASGVLLATMVLTVAGHVWLAQQPAIMSGTRVVRIAALSTYQPPQLHLTFEDEQKRVAAITSLLEQVDAADAVLLPESSAYVRFADETTFSNLSVIVDTENTREHNGDTYSRTVFRYADGRTEQSEKQFVLPIGEYVPYLYRLVLLFVPDPDFREQVRSTRSFVSGTETQFVNVQQGMLAVRFCDESMSPFLYARDARGGAHVLSNVSSYSWFHGSRTVFNQMQAIATVRAVENGRWYVQSGNMAPAYVLDHRGRVVMQTSWGVASVIEEQVPLRSGVTPYQWWGSLLPFLALFGVGVGMWLNRAKE